MILDGLGRACRLVLDGLGRVLRPSDVYSFETEVQRTIDVSALTNIQTDLITPAASQIDLPIPITTIFNLNSALVTETSLDCPML
jgi:hypothetical protein